MCRVSAHMTSARKIALLACLPPYIVQREINPGYFVYGRQLDGFPTMVPINTRTSTHRVEGESPCCISVMLPNIYPLDFVLAKGTGTNMGKGDPNMLISQLKTSQHDKQLLSCPMEKSASASSHKGTRTSQDRKQKFETIQYKQAIQITTRHFDFQTIWRGHFYRKYQCAEC